MKLIVGLGNPGYTYLHSRHNIGFSAVKALAKVAKATFKREASVQGWVARIRIHREQVILALPATFMNLSGRCVIKLVRKHVIDLEDLLIVCDDLDLGLERLKLRPRGSSGGHRGLESIISNLGSQDFARLRIGIGRPYESDDAAEYVLSPFTREERAKVRRIVDKACACCESWAAKGITKTMNIFNKSASTAFSTSTRSILSERSPSTGARGES